MLPKIKYPIYKTKMPSDNKTVKFRPFLVKEEKLLLMAASGNDEDEIRNNIMQVVNNCILDEDIDVLKLPVFDLEWLFLQIRIKSVSSVVDTIIKADKDSDCKICKKDTQLTIDLEEVECKKIDGHTNKIQLTDTIGIVMKYPTAETFKDTSDEDLDKMFNYIIDCIDYIYDDKKQYSLRDVDKKETMDFLESLDREQFSKIDDFFNTMPECKLEVSYKCKECGKELKYELRGLSDFLA